PLPWIFIQKPHAGIKRRSAPHLQREQIRRQLAGRLRNVQQVVSPYPGCEKRLMGVAERRIGYEQSVARPNPSQKSIYALLLQNLLAPRRILLFHRSDRDPRRFENGLLARRHTGMAVN